MVSAKRAKELVARAKQRKKESSSNVSTGSGGGGSSGSPPVTSTAPAPSTQPSQQERVVVENGKIVSGQTYTIKQRTAIQDYKAGRSFAGTPGTGFSQTSKGVKTTVKVISPELGFSSVENLNKQTAKIQQVPKATSVKAVSKFEELAERPYGAAQRKTVSQLKKEQQEYSQKQFNLLRRGSITAAPAKEAEALRRQETLTGQLTRGFLSPPTAERGQLLRTGRPLETAGALGRTMGEIFAFKAPTTRVGASTVSAVKSGISTPLGQTILRAAKVGGSIAIAPATKEISRLTAPGSQKELLGIPELRLAETKAFMASEAKAQKQGIIKNIAAQISPFFLDEGEYLRAGRQELQARGFKGQELETATKALKRQRIASGIGEAASFIAISAQAESIGRKGVVKAFEKAGTRNVARNQVFSQVFKKTFFPIAKAGAVEGGAQEVAQQITRRQNFNLKKVAGMSAFGAGSAGLLGGTIAGLAPVRPGASKAIEIGTFIADPFEKPGDLLADFGEAVAKRGFKRTIIKPSIFTPVISPSNVFTFTTTPTKTTGGKSRRSTIPTISFPTITPTPEPGSSSLVVVDKAPTLTETLESIINPVPTPTDTGTITPTPTNTGTPVNPFINILTNTETPTETTTTTPTPTFTPVPIPVTTPIFRIPPPLPLLGSGFPGGGRGLFSGFGKRVGINELAAGRAFLAGGLGAEIFSPAKAKKKPSKKRKHGSKTVRKRRK